MNYVSCSTDCSFKSYLPVFLTHTFDEMKVRSPETDFDGSSEVHAASPSLGGTNYRNLTDQIVQHLDFGHERL